MERNQRCPRCGAALPEEASFCPFCAGSINRRTAVEPPSLRGRCVLRALLFSAVLAAAVLAVFLLTRPRVYDGVGEVVYTDADGTYQLVLALPENRYEALAEQSFHAAEGEPYRVPSRLYINHTDSGADAGQLFLQKVDSATAELLPLDESLGTVSCSAPAPHSAAPDAALVSLVDFTARDAYTAQMVWTLHMTNGDTIRLRQELHVALIHTYNYHPEDAPMETLADLQALVDELAETAEPYDKLNLFLPPVTYEGSLVMEERPINLYGSEENGRRTTFTGTLRVASRDSWITYIQGIDFVGDGGVGISASARLWVEDCTFTGWKTGVLGYGDAWANVIGCTLVNNETGFHFNSEEGAASHSMYNDNRFVDNGTAVLLERVPTDLTLNFQDSLFYGNGTDIDNLCRQPIDITQAVFE